MGLNTHNNELNNDFKFNPPTAEENKKLTTPVKKSGERGLFQIFPVILSKNSVLERFSALKLHRTKRNYKITQ